MTDLIEVIEAVTVHVRDIERARRFYRDVLGLREVSHIEQISRAAYAIRGSETLLTMHVQGDGEGGREPGTVSGVVFSHHDPVSAAAEIRKRGGAIVDEPHTFRNLLGEVTLFVFADPDGNQFVVRRIRP